MANPCSFFTSLRKYPLTWKALPTYPIVPLNLIFLLITSTFNFSSTAVITTWDTIYLLIYQVSQTQEECKHPKGKCPDSLYIDWAQNKIWQKKYGLWSQTPRFKCKHYRLLTGWPQTSHLYFLASVPPYAKGRNDGTCYLGPKIQFFNTRSQDNKCLSKTWNTT